MPRLAGKGRFLKQYFRLLLGRRAYASRTAYLALSQDFTSFKGGRYFSLLAYYLHMGGYRIVLVGEIGQSLGLVRHRFAKPLIESLVFSGIRRHLPSHLPSAALVVTDLDHVRPEARVARLRFGYELKSGGDYDIAMPYGMFPAHYISGVVSTIRKLRSDVKSMRVFFSGSRQEDTYNSKRFVRQYSKLNRYQTINCLYASQTEKHYVTEAEGLGEACQPPFSPGLTLIDTDQVRVPERAWLPTLAKSDFFLACVGASMPLAHNAVESLGVGVIPILSYPEFFEPPLVDGETCLVFSDCASLEDAITRAVEMSTEKVAEIRARVTRYYDSYLDPCLFIEKLDESLALSQSVRVGLPFCDARLGQDVA